MEIIIPKQDNSIMEEISLTLGDYTIFAGENNSGKTNLMKGIKKELEDSNLHVIYIPAEKVIAEKEMDTSTQQDFLRTAIIELINVDFEPKNITDPIADIEKELPVEFDRFGIENIELAVKLGKPKKDEDYIKSVKDIYAKKIIESVTITDGFSGKNKISISSVGQGTQRLIIASLLNYLSKKKNIQNNKLALIFEEPEIFLHPRLKESLHKNLLSLSKDMLVIISTHDPMFVQLGAEKNIYRVFRKKEEKNGSTQIEVMKKKYLNYDSYAETNYQIFNLSSETYFLEIYDETNRKKGFDSAHYKQFDDLMFNNYFNTKGLTQNFLDDNNMPVTPMTRLRHNIAHGKNDNPPIDLKEAISNIIDFIENSK